MEKKQMNTAIRFNPEQQGTAQVFRGRIEGRHQMEGERPAAFSLTAAMRPKRPQP